MDFRKWLQRAEATKVDSEFEEVGGREAIQRVNEIAHMESARCLEEELDGPGAYKKQ